MLHEVFHSDLQVINYASEEEECAAASARA
jgi:hypothetical protein